MSPRFVSISLSFTVSLTISKTGEGTGAMTDYSSLDDVPWNSYRDSITTLVVESGVTTIGSYAMQYSNVASATLPDTVTSIGQYAFYSVLMTSVTLPDSLMTIGHSAFGSRKLEGTMTIPDSVVTVEPYAFSYTKITTMSIGAGVSSIGESNLDNNILVSIAVSDTNGSVTFTGKTVTVSMPYTLKDGEDASKIQVFYIDSGNKAVKVDASYDADSKCVVFSTDHFSTWYVDFDNSTPGGGSGNMTLIIVAVVIVAIIAVVAFLIFTGKIDISALTAKKE